MEAALIVITLVSLGTTAAAIAIAFRAVRRERRRSAARVAALAAALGTGPEAEPDVAREVPGAGCSSWQRQTADVPPRREAPLEQRGPEPGVPLASIGRTGDVPRRLGPALAAGALIVATVAGSAIAFGRRGTNHETATPAAAGHRLELVALGHERRTGTLTIAGLVRNPSAGRRVLGLTAVVTVLDARGSFVSRHDVPLDDRSVEPGEERPFSVTMPDAETIGRYRVSFRTSEGRAEHIDRRGGTMVTARAS